MSAVPTECRAAVIPAFAFALLEVAKRQKMPFRTKTHISLGVVTKTALVTRPWRSALCLLGRGNDRLDSLRVDLRQFLGIGKTLMRAGRPTGLLERRIRLVHLLGELAQAVVVVDHVALYEQAVPVIHDGSCQVGCSLIRILDYRRELLQVVLKFRYQALKFRAIRVAVRGRRTLAHRVCGRP